MGWSVWQEDVVLAQWIVIAALVLAVVAQRAAGLNRDGLWQGGFYFLSGMGVGMLAYHGEVSILIGALWLALSFWIEQEIRIDVKSMLDSGETE
jgi:hypothetical protein